jgi:hypothetical protein
MSNVKYPQLQDTPLLKRLLLVEKKPIDEVCKILGEDGKSIPYNCLNFQIRTKFTAAEQAKVVGRRRHYSREEKRTILKECKEAVSGGGKPNEVAKKYGVQLHQILAWRRRFSEEKIAKQKQVDPTL